MRDVVIGEITNSKKLNRRKQRDNPDRFLGLSGFACAVL